MNQILRIFLLSIVLYSIPSVGLGQQKVESVLNGTGATQTDENQTYQAVLAVIKSGQLEAAAKLLDKYLVQKPHAHRLWLLRRSLAARYVRSGMREEADQQLEMIVRYAIENPVDGKPLLKYIAQIMISISYVQLGQEPQAGQILDPALAMMEKASASHPENAAISSGVSSLVNYKARILTRTDPQSTIDLYKRELNRLRLRRNKKVDDPSAWFVLAYNLKSAADTVGDGVSDTITMPWRWEHTNILTYGINAFPASVDILDAFISDRLRLIGRYEELELLVTNQLFNELIARFDTIFENSQSKKLLIPIKLKIHKRAQGFRRKLAQNQLLGETAPELGTVNWMNGDRSRIGESGGPAVLYFDNWRGAKPYHELKKLATYFKSSQDKRSGELVALLPTAGQTFDWLVAMPKKLEFTPEQTQRFLDNFKQKFIADEGFKFPVGLIQDSGGVGERFGITELPVAVIISKDGAVTQMFYGKGLAESVIDELSK